VLLADFVTLSEFDMLPKQAIRGSKLSTYIFHKPSVREPSYLLSFQSQRAWNQIIYSVPKPHGQGTDLFIGSQTQRSGVQMIYSVPKAQR
jgi:hypothetical protein